MARETSFKMGRAKAGKLTDHSGRARQKPQTAPHPRSCSLRSLEHCPGSPCAPVAGSKLSCQRLAFLAEFALLQLTSGKLVISALQTGAHRHTARELQREITGMLIEGEKAPTPRSSPARLAQAEEHRRRPESCSNSQRCTSIIAVGQSMPLHGHRCGPAHCI